MMKFLVAVLACAVSLCSAAHITEEACTMYGPQNVLTGQQLFDSLVSGAGLTLCPYTEEDGQQCCSQGNQEALRSTLQQALRYNHTLGQLGLVPFRNGLRDLASDSAMLADQVRNRYLGNLLESSVDGATGSNTDRAGLNYQRDLFLARFEMLVSQNANVNLTGDIVTFLRNGVSMFHLNVTLGGFPSGDSGCALNFIYRTLFANVVTDISRFGTTLKRIGEAFYVIGQANATVHQLLDEIANFDLSDTCADIWARQYACPLCVAQQQRLCLQRCDEVLIGCFSPLQQAIVQMNALAFFVTNITADLFTPDTPSLNVTAIPDLFTAIFSDISPSFSVDILGAERECTATKRRSAEDIPRVKRSGGGGSFNFEPLSTSLINTIGQEARGILDDYIPADLSTDRARICNLLQADGTVNCTIGVGQTVPTYNSNFRGSLDVIDQVANPAGGFDFTELINQASTLPYVISDLLTRPEVMELYSTVQPGVTPPNRDFLTVTPTPTPTNPGGGAAVISSSIVLLALGAVLAMAL